METHERHRPFEEPGSPEGGPEADSDPEAESGLERTRRAGEEFLAAGDEAIERALSGDSERFLRSVRQTGGQ